MEMWKCLNWGRKHEMVQTWNVEYEMYELSVNVKMMLTCQLEMLSGLMEIWNIEWTHGNYEKRKQERWTLDTWTLLELPNDLSEIIMRIYIYIHCNLHYDTLVYSTNSVKNTVKAWKPLLILPVYKALIIMVESWYNTGGLVDPNISVIVEVPVYIWWYRYIYIYG